MKTYYNFGLVDVISKRYIPGSFMKINNDRICKIGLDQELTIQEKEQAVDLCGKTVMPGMFNIHAHALSTPIANPASLNIESESKFALRGLNHLQQHLKSGVTFVRDMNGRKLAEIGLRDAIKQGIVLGPHYIIARQCLCMTGGHGSNTGRECDGIDDCRKAAREQIKGGADFIKIMATGGILSPGMRADATQLDQDEMAAAIFEAHKAGLKTATHAHGASGIKNAVRAGIDSVEHGSYLDDECIDLMLQNNTALVPTLAVDYFLEEFGAKNGVNPALLEKSKLAKEKHIVGFLKAWKAGIPIGIGTDAGTPFNLHSATYLEFVLMVKLGLNPMDVLVCGTIGSARIVGVDDWTGSLTEGKLADFLVMQQNPVEDISCLANIEMVFLAGKRVLIPEISSENA